MKTIFFSLILLICSSGSLAQADTSQQLYKRFPTPPPFRLQLTDSATIFTDKDLKKNMPLLIMMFSPDCEHCQHHAEEMVKNKEKFSKIQIVMATMFPLWKIKEFYAKYQLDKMPSLVIGRDREFILGTFYKFRSIPFLAFYNKKGELMETAEGGLPVDRIIEIFKK